MAILIDMQIGFSNQFQKSSQQNLYHQIYMPFSKEGRHYASTFKNYFLGSVFTLGGKALDNFENKFKVINIHNYIRKLYE